MWDNIKSHPYVVGGVVLLVVWYLMSGSGDATAAPSGGTSADEMAYNLQVQGMQTSANAAAAHDQASLAALQLTGDNTYALAVLSQHTQENANQLSANIALEQINATAQTVALQTTKQAEVQIANINANVQTAAIASNTQIQTTALTTAAMVAQTKAMADAIKSATKCHGLGCLF